MAVGNFLFDAAKEGFLDGSVRWADVGSATVPVIKTGLIRGYTFNAADKFMSDVVAAGGVLVRTTDALGSKTKAGGVARAANASFGQVPAGAACTALVIFQASAVTGGADVSANAQRLIAYIDTATNLPITPNGGQLDLAFDSGANGVFRL